MRAFVLVTLGLLLFGSRDAHADCPPIVSPPPPDAIALANEGDELRATNLDGAIEKYVAATKIDPDNHRIVWKLAGAQFKKEEWQAVVPTLDTAIRLAPKHANYRYTRGLAHARIATRMQPSSSEAKDTWKSARADFEAAIALDPHLADAHFELAEVLVRSRGGAVAEKEALVHYHHAIESNPTVMVFWGSLADLYMRLNQNERARKVLVESLTFVEQGPKRFAIHSLLGQVEEERGDQRASLEQYETAKKSCGPCNEAGQQIAFFNLGAAYATAKPPRKSEAMAQLQSFHKMICKGAAAARYADQCTQAHQLATVMGGSLQ